MNLISASCNISVYYISFPFVAMDVGYWLSNWNSRKLRFNRWGMLRGTEESDAACVPSTLLLLLLFQNDKCKDQMLNVLRKTMFFGKTRLPSTRGNKCSALSYVMPAGLAASSSCFAVSWADGPYKEGCCEVTALSWSAFVMPTCF